MSEPARISDTDNLPAPTLEQVRACVGGFDPVLHGVGQRRLDDLPRMVREANFAELHRGS